MSVVILHTGQTGVERGGCRAARMVELEVRGFCQPTARDELGALPPEIRSGLQPTEKTGARAAVYATLELANAVVICVPKAASANRETGVEALRRQIASLDMFSAVVDPSSDLDVLTGQLLQLEATTGRLALFVTGPRMTRWKEGERLGWQVVSALAINASLEPGAKVSSSTP